MNPKRHPCADRTAVVICRTCLYKVKTLLDTTVLPTQHIELAKETQQIKIRYQYRASSEALNALRFIGGGGGGGFLARDGGGGGGAFFPFIPISAALKLAARDMTLPLPTDDRSGLGGERSRLWPFDCP